MAFTYTYNYEALVKQNASLPCWEQKAQIGEIQFMNQSGEEAMCSLLNNGFSNPFLSTLPVLDCQGF